MNNSKIKKSIEVVKLDKEFHHELTSIICKYIKKYNKEEYMEGAADILEDVYYFFLDEDDGVLTQEISDSFYNSEIKMLNSKEVS